MTTQSASDGRELLVRSFRVKSASDRENLLAINHLAIQSAPSSPT